MTTSAARLAMAAGKKGLAEHGFWEYTCPLTGGFENYDLDDYRLALDDMAGAGMNSIMILVKWLTTGYRSRLPYMDQLPGNRMIESDNTLLQQVIPEAKQRGIKVWLGAVTSFFDSDKFGSIPYVVQPSGTSLWKGALGFPFGLGYYDPDAPSVRERTLEILDELLDLFPSVDGMMLEVEVVQNPAPHRVPYYEEWAARHDRPPFAELNITFTSELEHPAIGNPHWLDYATYSRITLSQQVEAFVRQRGFTGDLCTINKPGLMNQAYFHHECPAWKNVGYTYVKGEDRARDAEWMRDVVTQQQGLGIDFYYLPRGVMTDHAWDSRERLERSWDADIADIQKFRPNNVWWFGAGSKSEKGSHTSLSLLRRMGFKDDVEARRALLEKTATLKTLGG